MRTGQDGRHSAAGRRFVGLLAVAIAASVIGTAAAAWDGRQDVVLGDSFSSAFKAAPGDEVHRYDFYAPAGTTLNAAIKVDNGAGLVPGWAVFAEDGTPVDLGSALNGPKIKKFGFAAGGAYYFQVTATAGTGRYAVATKANFPTKLKQKNVDGGFSFEAVAGMELNGKLKGADITSLTGPMGAVDLGGATTKLKNIFLPDNGEYTFAWTGTASFSGKLKSPSKTAWYFDNTEDTRGIATLMRNEWLGSGHADRNAEPFRHWDEDGEVSASCARCHSSPGFQDFLGADGSASAIDTPSGRAENPAPLGTTVDCDACHNSVTPTLDRVTFPSGEVVTGLGPEARCMQCHQGRESTVSLDDTITAAAVAHDDTESSALRFRNIHYFAAGASLYGNAAKGAYQFAGKIYNNKFPHVSTVDACQKCHNQHTLEIRYELCGTCHSGVASNADLHNIRHLGSVLDYDADGNASEGIYNELDTMAGKVYDAMRQYAGARGFQIQYSADSYPYFYNDVNGNGAIDAEDGSYNHWTARLLRAAYNYQYWQKDPGAFAHNGKYMVEILYDTLEHLNADPNVTVSGFDQMVRNDSGHFDNTAEAFRHWDGDGEVSASCARCHSPGGFAFTVQYGIDPVTPWPYGDGFACEQCHMVDDFSSPSPARYYVDKVEFPSGVVVQNDPDAPDDSFLCMTCHKGRESKTTVDEAIALDADGQNLRFKNIHYLAAGPSIFGSDAGVGYEYDGMTYPGKFPHAGGGTNSCAFCHLSDHSFLPKLSANCQVCHPEAGGNLEAVRRDRATDYDGDGNNTELLKDEVASFGDALLLAMQDYAAKQGLPTLAYDAHAYPYFTNGDAGGNYPFDAPLLKASFNYQMWQKEPGAWAHNTKYILDLLYDSMVDLQTVTAVPLDQDYTTGFTRP